MDINRKEKDHQENQGIDNDFWPAADKFVVSADYLSSSSDRNNGLTSTDQKRIMTVEETAHFLRKSPTWVYRHAEELGGRKLGGSLFFPSKEDLYEHLFGRREGVEVRIRTQQSSIHQSRIQKEKRGQSSRGRKTKGVEKSKHDPNAANRHGLFGPCEPTA
jgi:hypothetical protein